MAHDDKRRVPIALLLLELPALHWTVAAAGSYGEVKALLKRQGSPIGEMDTRIAAHALAEKQILVTHNTQDSKKASGLKVEYWMT